MSSELGEVIPKTVCGSLDANYSCADPIAPEAVDHEFSFYGANLAFLPNNQIVVDRVNLLQPALQLRFQGDRPLDTTLLAFNPPSYRRGLLSEASAELASAL